jgi:galactofuranose transport system permease protein
MKFHFNSKYIPISATILVFILFYLVSGFMFTGFFSLQVFINFFIDNSFLGVAAIGMTFVILSGGIDLSVGSMLAFASVFTATMVQKNHLDPLVVIPMVLACGAILGLVMGCLIHYFNAPPFIVTLGGQFLARGLSQVISLQSIPITHPFFQSFITDGIPLPGEIIFPWIAVIFVAVFLAAFAILHYTTFGRNVYALGGSPQSAILMGLPVAKTRVLIYTLSGLVSALAGVVYTMYTSAGYSLAGRGFEMDAIASVVIGGTLLTGGVGLVAGTVIGVLIQGIIQTFISFQGTLSSWWTRIVIGFIMFLFILLQRFLSRIPVSEEKTAVRIKK